MAGLPQIRLAALLHDIGKPECWANKKPWSLHVEYGRRLISEVFSEDLADLATKHHTSSSYGPSEQPSSNEQRIISVADHIASGSDRPDEPEGGSPYPSPPISLSHVLSTGGVSVHESSAVELQIFPNKFRSEFKGKDAGFEAVFDFLEWSSALIPAETRRPNNDVSLWDHLRLTSAIANCIWRQGYKGREPSDYTFALLSGDVDGISRYVGKSLRLPDLRARSGRIEEATRKATRLVAERVGIECILYQGGGSFLALTTPDIAETLVKGVEEVFREATGGQSSITVSSVEADGSEVQKCFGILWQKSSNALHSLKSGKDVRLVDPISEESSLCDGCGENIGTNTGKILHIDASTRPELLCDDCAKIREEGRSGRSLEDVVESTRSIAVIRFDGDDVGEMLSGERLKQRFDKTTGPGRLATLSRLLNQTCKVEMRGLIEREKGIPIFEGGDDILAITSGERGLCTSLRLAETFSERCANQATASAGLVICDSKLPIYYALEKASELLKGAKHTVGKGAVAFAFLEGMGGERLTGSRRAYRWGELKELLTLVRNLDSKNLPAGQLRSIVARSGKSELQAEVLLKYQIGREKISWDVGHQFLRYIRSGFLADAFKIHSYFKGGMKFD